MTCVSQDTLQTFLDNELETSENTRVTEHLRDCAPCSRELANTVRLKRATHQAGQRFTPSAAFQRKMMTQITGAKPQRQSWWSRAMLAIPAAALVVLFTVALVLMSHERSVNAGRELADLHVATLASANPVDVVSSDKHTVKPWFAGKVPFTFNIPDLNGSQYEMVGGRMAYVAQAPAAQLIFKHGRHYCSIFIVEERSGVPTDIRAPMNFTVMNWRQNGLVYLLITDASPDTMRDLAERMKKAA